MSINRIDYDVYAVNVWNLFTGIFYYLTISIELWLVENLCNCKDVVVEGVRWEVLFGVLA